MLKSQSAGYISNFHGPNYRPGHVMDQRRPRRVAGCARTRPRRRHELLGEVNVALTWNHGRVQLGAWEIYVTCGAWLSYYVIL